MRGTPHWKEGGKGVPVAGGLRGGGDVPIALGPPTSVPALPPAQGGRGLEGVGPVMLLTLL